MTHTIRRGLVWLHDGELVHRRQHRTLHRERVADRRKQRRQARQAEAAALAEYYEDMDWLAKFEAEILALQDEYDSQYGMFDLIWDIEEEERERERELRELDDLEVYDPYCDYGWEAWEERYA
jgi:hypothetical protein